MPLGRRHIEFIRRISSDHPEWGEDRIALELELKLGAAHDPSTVRVYMIEGGIANIPHVVAGRLRARQPPTDGSGRLLALPVLGGLAHDYQIAA